MGYIDRIDRHANLVNRMADTVGADMGAALLEGRVTAEDLRGAVLRCTRCAHVETCVGWLGRNEAAGADATPEYCRNRQLMARVTA